MTNPVKFSSEELEAMEDLGGIEFCKKISDLILRDYGIQKSLISDHDLEVMSGLRNDELSQKKIEFDFDPDRSIRANIDNLLSQAKEVQSNSGGTNYVGAMLQHLVGAKLDIVLGKGAIEHHGFSVADHSTERKGDFQIDLSTFHVTTHPTEALIRKCAQNLKEGLKPVIITIDEGVVGAKFLLSNSQMDDRVDILDASQFLTANVYEHSLFQSADYKSTLTRLLLRYNEIVSECETDPFLMVTMPDQLEK